MSEKKSRKELLKQQDTFIVAANQSATWIKGHRGSVVASGVGLLVVSVSLWAMLDHFDSRDRAASQLYAAALLLADASPSAGGAGAGEAKPNVPSFASKDEQWKAERDAFAKVVERAPGSGVANMARFYVADLSTKLGETDKAILAFDELASKLSEDDSLYFLAIERGADLREQKADLDGAIAEWQHLQGGSKRFYADRALYNLARLHHVKGDAQKARELLGRFEKEFTVSSLREDVEQLYAVVGRDEVKLEAAATAGNAGEEKKATP